MRPYIYYNWFDLYRLCLIYNPGDYMKNKNEVYAMIYLNKSVYLNIVREDFNMFKNHISWSNEVSFMVQLVHTKQTLYDQSEIFNGGKRWSGLINIIL